MLPHRPAPGGGPLAGMEGLAQDPFYIVRQEIQESVRGVAGRVGDAIGPRGGAVGLGARDGSAAPRRAALRRCTPLPRPLHLSVSSSPPPLRPRQVHELQQKMSRFHGLAAANPERRQIAASVRDGCESLKWQARALWRSTARLACSPAARAARGCASLRVAPACATP